MKARNSYELDLMRKSGKISAAALKYALNLVKSGISGLEVDKSTEKEIYRLGGDLSYKSIPEYSWATCITINEAVVHGIPTTRKFVEGDIVSIDLATVYKGWHTDTAWTVLIKGKGERGKGKEEEEKERFLKVGEEALWEGIAQAVEGNKVGDISSAIQSKVEGAGYFIVRSLVGHGIGRELHEDPEVPGYGRKGTGLALRSGMTIAIEVIYTKGTPDVVLGKDGWTYNSADGSWGAVFEMTVVIGKGKAEVLTDIGKV